MQMSSTKLAILALGAHEQHANHLPPETDSIIAQNIIKELKNIFGHNKDIKFLPTQTIGYSPEHLFDARTKSLSYIEAVENIVKLAPRDIDKLLLINTHGGNSPIMAIAAMELRSRLSTICAYTSWLRFGIDPQLISAEEKHLDIHGGFVETSVMLYLAPELVNMHKAKKFYNKQQDYINNYKYLRAYGPHSFGWLMQDLNEEGACGDASKANAEAGTLIFTQACKGLEGLINEFINLTL